MLWVIKCTLGQSNVHYPCEAETDPAVSEYLQPMAQA